MARAVWLLALLRALSADAQAPLSGAKKHSFKIKGYHIADGLLADEAPRLIEEMRRLMAEASEEDAAAWDGNGASKYTVTYQPDAETGEAIPGRIMKIQGVATRSPLTRELTIFNPKLVDVAAQLMGLGPEEGMDAFGTKFFPLLPVHNGTTKSTSTDFHDDNHFFGTPSDRVLSMSLYLEDTHVETGCLRVVPGSHSAYGDGTDREARYARGLKEASHGEWLDLLDSEMALDVPVPAGTPVFFDGRLVHGARQNVSPEKSSFRIIAHFVPADLEMSWRGVDFGKDYADRWEVRAPLAQKADL